MLKTAMHHASPWRRALLRLLPLPFLALLALMAAAFWQNDADFLLGRYETFEARLLDPGLPQTRRGRPHYFPTFLRSNGERLHVAVGQLATELPTVGEPVSLRCSTQRPGLCKMPGAPVLDPVFYGIAAVWTAGTLALTFALWGPRRQRGQRSPAASPDTSS